MTNGILTDVCNSSLGTFKGLQLTVSKLCMSSAFYVYRMYIQVHFRLDFIMKTNTMNPDQAAPLGAV